MLPGFDVGDVRFSTYLCSALLIVAAGMLLGRFLWARAGRREGRPPAAAAWVWLFLLPFGLVGGRLFYYVQHPHAVWGRPLALLELGGGGSAAWGPYLAWVAGGFLLARSRRSPGWREDVWRAADILLPAVLLAHALWRSLCCFMAGCCHGRPAFGFPLAVTFNDPRSACVYRGIPVHPVQLYEAAGVLLILAGVLWLGRRARPPGTLVWAWFLSYGVLRFCLEFLRGDERGMIAPWLSMNQGVSVFFVVLSAWMLWRAGVFMVRRRPVGVGPEGPAGPVDDGKKRG